MPVWIRATSLIGGLLLVATIARAQIFEPLREEAARGGFTLRADTLDYDQARDLYVASGNVRIEQTEDRWLAADWLMFNATTRKGVATGNVELVDGEDRLQARFAAVDLETLNALLTDAELDASRTGYLLEADTIEKSGEQTYRTEEGTITTCRCPPGSKRRPWEVQAGRTDLRVGGYAVARDVLFRVLEIPVAYSPWVILPVKTERQSGFLFPDLGSSSRGGREIQLPFFWAARPNLNVLLKPTYFSERGFGSGADVEYVFGEEGYGRGGAFVLPGDDDVSRDDPDTRFSNDRWAYWLRHEQPLAPGVRFGTDLLHMSDNNYVLDFKDRPSEAHNLRFSESRAWTTAARRGLFAGVELVTFDDLGAPNDLDRDSFLLHRLPDVRVAAMPHKLGPLRLRGAVDMRYTYFHQVDHPEDYLGKLPVADQFFDTGIDGQFNLKEPDNRGAFLGNPNSDQHLDDFDPVTRPSGTEGDLRFQEGELLADRGHRVEFYPRLSLPQQFGPVEALAEIGFREALYFPSRADSESRELWTGRADVRTRLERLYHLGALPVRHVMEPSLGFAFVSRQEQSDNPLFLPPGTVPQQRIRAADPRVALRTQTDRLPDQRFGLAAVTHRLFAPPAGVGEAARQLAEVRLGSGYDFEEGRVLNLFFEGEVRPSEGVSLDLQLGYDSKESRMEEMLARLSFGAPSGNHFGVTYRYLREFNPVFDDYAFSSDVFKEADADFKRVNQLGLDGSYRVTPRFELFGDLYVSFEESRVQHSMLGFIYHSRCLCWDLLVAGRQKTRPSQTELLVQIRLAGLGFGSTPR